MGDDNYFKVIGKLKQEGIKYRTKSLFNQNLTPFGGDRFRQYEIYIMNQDVEKASRALAALRK